MIEIHFDFIRIKEDHLKYELNDSEMQELSAISGNPTYATIKYVWEMNLNRDWGTPFIIDRRKNLIQEIVFLEKLLPMVKNFRIRNIVKARIIEATGFMQFLTPDRDLIANLINANPNMSDAGLGQYCIDNNISIYDDIIMDKNIKFLKNCISSVRETMQSHPQIWESETRYAERWIEIFERTNGR